MKIKLSVKDAGYYLCVNIFSTVLLLVVLIPLINIVASSFSSPNAVLQGKVFLWPVNFSLKGYEEVFKNPDIFRSYLNTFKYTFFGTVINVLMTVILAYPLSRKDFPGRNYIMLLFTFTMIFSGGMIPSYILMKDLHILNTAWVMVIPGAISVYNMIITRTFIINSIPQELLEASQLDGCSDIKYLMTIVLPLSKAVLAVITLYYAVGHWNAYFSAFLYLNDRNLVPLQIVLRDILMANVFEGANVLDPEIAAARQGIADLIKYSLIIVATLPILIVYPFLVKFFEKGVMIGSIKG